MTIECYFGQCEFHSCHDPGEEGPFCYENECRLTEEELKKHRLQQQKDKEARK